MLVGMPGEKARGSPVGPLPPEPQNCGPWRPWGSAARLPSPRAGREVNRNLEWPGGSARAGITCYLAQGGWELCGALGQQSRSGGLRAWGRGSGGAVASGQAVVLEHWDKFPGAKPSTRAGLRSSLPCFPLPPVYPEDINGTGRTRHRSLTLLGPEDSEGQWQVKNFKRALSWPARANPFGLQRSPVATSLHSPYLPLQMLPVP